MQKANIVRPTQADIDGWKETHKNIFQIDLGDKLCILRKPGRQDLDYASKAGEGPFKFNEALLKTIWLGGDLEFQTDDDYFLSVSKQLGEIVKAQEATLKKL